MGELAKRETKSKRGNRGRREKGLMVVHTHLELSELGIQYWPCPKFCSDQILRVNCRVVKLVCTV